MLVLQEHNAEERQRKEGVKSLMGYFSKKLEQVINANQHEDSYWVLCKIRFPKGKAGRVFVQACKERPPFVRDSFVYSINTKMGAKELVWSCRNGHVFLYRNAQTLGISAADVPKQLMGD